MRTSLIAVALACSLAAPAYADVTIRTVATGPLPGEASSVSYIKGTKMRTDVTLSGMTRSTIIDADARQMIVLDPATRQAEVYDMSAMADQMQKAASVQNAKVSMTPNGETKQLLGRTCTGYNLSISVPVAMGQDMVTVTIGGPVWIAKGAPGTSDFVTFFKAASKNGLFFAPPAGRGGMNPGINEQGMALMYRELANADGIPYEQQTTIETNATGAAADMMRRMGAGGTTATTRVTSISTDPIPADRFEIPAGYTKKSSSQ